MTRVGLAAGVLTSEEVQYIEKAIVKTVRPMLIGRQLMPKLPLAHAGFTSYIFYDETDMGEAKIDMRGEEANIDRVELTKHTVAIPIIHKEYLLHWRDVEMRRQTGQDLNTQHAENAARQCAEEEDKLILSGEYSGWRALGLEGIMTATNRQTTAGGDFSANYLTYVSAAKKLLRDEGFYGPYRLLITGAWYSQLEVLISNTEKWAFQAVGELIGGVENILITDNIHAADGGVDSIALIDIQPGNYNLVVGQDISNYLHKLPSMNLQGKVWEAVVPVIKRPKAICEITDLT